MAGGFFYNLGAGIASAFGRATTPRPAPVAPRAPQPVMASTPSGAQPANRTPDTASRNPLSAFGRQLYQRGVDVSAYLQRMIQVESGGRANARNPLSSAVGGAQFIESTWLAYAPKYIPEAVKGKTRAQILALRTDPALTLRVAEGYTLENAKRLDRLGAPITHGTLYLAHFAGVGTAAKITKADPRTPIVNIMGQRAVDANPNVLRGKTAGQVVAWAENKMQGIA